MNFDKDAFNSICDDLIFKNNQQTDSSKTGEDLVRLGWLLAQSSIALNHPAETTCAIHEENLQKYRKFVSSKQSKPVFNSKGFCSDFNLNSKDFEKYLPSCRGECGNEKLSKEDIDALLPKTVPQSGQNNKRPFSDAPSSSEPMKKFVFRTMNPTNPTASLVPSLSSTVSDRTADDGIRFNERRLVVPSDHHDRVRITNQPIIEKRNDREFATPSSSTTPPLFAFDRTKKSSESNTSRDNSSFITAREELLRRQALKGEQNANPRQTSEQNKPLFAYGKSTKTLGLCRSVHSNFVPPITPVASSTNVQQQEANRSVDGSDIDPRLRNIEPKMIERESSVVPDCNDIAGLEYAKRTIQEAVVYPILRPDIFTGLRGPPRGILLFGPPGTGKTLIGRCIASRSRSTFFSISASSLTSKWIGEGEKMVRALFAVAAVNQPAVIFIDEIDSLLSQRSDNEHESSRRLKTEFLVQLDGARTTDDERILIVGATNRPQELDEAARRRLTKRLYIPLPEVAARIQILTSLLQKEPNQIDEQEIAEIGRLTDGFSGADMKTLCHEALMGPIRSISLEDMESIDVNDVPRVSFLDFTNALRRVRASVSKDDLLQYEKWDSTYGLGAAVK